MNLDENTKWWLLLLVPSLSSLATALVTVILTNRPQLALRWLVILGVAAVPVGTWFAGRASVAPCPKEAAQDCKQESVNQLKKTDTEPRRGTPPSLNEFSAGRSAVGRESEGSGRNGRTVRDTSEPATRLHVDHDGETIRLRVLGAELHVEYIDLQRNGFKHYLCAKVVLPGIPTPDCKPVYKIGSSLKFPRTNPKYELTLMSEPERRGSDWNLVKL